MSTEFYSLTINLHNGSLQENSLIQENSPHAHKNSIFYEPCLTNYLHKVTPTYIFLPFIICLLENMFFLHMRYRQDFYAGLHTCIWKPISHLKIAKTHISHRAKNPYHTSLGCDTGEMGFSPYGKKAISLVLLSNLGKQCWMLQFFPLIGERQVWLPFTYHGSLMIYIVLSLELFFQIFSQICFKHLSCCSVKDNSRWFLSISKYRSCTCSRFIIWERIENVSRWKDANKEEKIYDK